VYAGVDPVTGRANYLTESAATQKQAERALRRLTAEVEEQRGARTKATLAMAVDAWLKIHEVEDNTLRGYEANARRYIKPALGEVPLGKVTAQRLRGPRRRPPLVRDDQRLGSIPTQRLGPGRCG
jgi:hypothetical protein